VTTHGERYSRERLAGLADHVCYELRMLAALADRLFPRPNSALKDSAMCNAFIESFLLHARLLDEFFGAKSRGPRNRDVRASDFHPGWQRRYVLTPDERDGIDGKVMHLADDRVEHFPWWFGEILVRFVDVFEEFTSEDRMRGEMFDSALSEAQIVADIYRPAAEAGRPGWQDVPEAPLPTPRCSL
jgi:hypothetical protein